MLLFNKKPATAISPRSGSPRTQRGIQASQLASKLAQTPSFEQEYIILKAEFLQLMVSLDPQEQKEVIADKQYEELIVRLGNISTEIEILEQENKEIRDEKQLKKLYQVKKEIYLAIAEHHLDKMPEVPNYILSVNAKLAESDKQHLINLPTAMPTSPIRKGSLVRTFSGNLRETTNKISATATLNFAIKFYFAVREHQVSISDNGDEKIIDSYERFLEALFNNPDVNIRKFHHVLYLQKLDKLNNFIQFYVTNYADKAISNDDPNCAVINLMKSIMLSFIKVLHYSLQKNITYFTHKMDLTDYTVETQIPVKYQIAIKEWLNKIKEMNISQLSITANFSMTKTLSSK